MDVVHDSFVLREILIILAIAGIIVPLCKRCRISPILSYLVVGILLGPFGMTLLAAPDSWINVLVISNMEWVSMMAEFGIMLLLFMIGLELSLMRLWQLRSKVFGLGGLQILSSTLIISLIAHYFGNSVNLSILIGACFALSSTATVISILKERRQMGSEVGSSSFSILLMQDLAVVPIIILVTAFAGAGGEPILYSVARSLLHALLAIGGIYIIGRLLLRPFLHYLGGAGSGEWFMAVMLLIVMGAALLTAQAGLSMALGAFLAGLLIAETEYRHEVEVTLDPLKGVFMGVFFISVGMTIDVRQIMLTPDWLFISVVGIILIKATIITGLCRLWRLPLAQSIEIGLLLGQAGEFAFVIIGMTHGAGLMSREGAQFFLLVAAITMLLTPLIASFASHLRKWLERVSGTMPEWICGEAEARTGHLIIAGFGRSGKTIAQIANELAIPYVAIDQDGAAVAKSQNAHYPVVYADARRAEIWHKLNVRGARGVVITVDDGKAAREMLTTVRRICPLIPVVVRAHDLTEAQGLYDLQATQVVPEALETSLQIAKNLLREIKVDEDEISRILRQQRAGFTTAPAV